MSDPSNVMAEKKLILLYIVDKIGIPISNSEVAQIVIEKNYMNYFSLQLYLSELVTSNFLIQTKEKNNTRYTITEDGVNTLNYFTGYIPDWIKYEINEYVLEHSNAVRTEFEMSANYFRTVNGDFMVKCGVYEYDGTALMEVNVTVPNKEQARIICGNWKDNLNYLYGKILSELVVDRNK